MSYLEIMMLVCFGASWPFSIAKSLRRKSVEGKSVIFLYVIVAGYLFGIAHKLLYNFDPVTYLYLFNVGMVTVDIGLWYRYRRRDPVPAAV